MSSRKRANTPGRHRHAKRADDRDPVQVTCRLRPLSSNESEACVVAIDEEHVKLVPPAGYILRNGLPPVETTYKFSAVFDETASQRMVFDQTSLDLVQDVIKGKDGLLFTYGVTGSGKTYTMTGTPKNQKDGILPHTLDILFNSLLSRADKCIFVPDGRNGFEVQPEGVAMLERARLALRTPCSKFEFKYRIPDTRAVRGANDDYVYAVFVSYIEIYNNVAYDLLETTPLVERGEKPRPPTGKGLHQDSKGNMYVDKVTEVEVSSTEEAFEQFVKGQERRRVAQTMLNAESSRSHSVFNIRLVMAPLDASGCEPVRDSSLLHVSQLSLVDLAGSERSKRTENTGDRLFESGKINQSLMTLRQCIEKLRENQKTSPDRAGQVPYRDQKLTHLFKNYFEGQGKVRMIVCVNPSVTDYEENVFVMSFAEQAQDVEIVRAVEVNFGNGNLPVSRRRMAQWNNEIESALRGHNDGFPDTQAFSVFFDAPPPFELNGPGDSDSIARLRQHYQSTYRKRQDYGASAEQKVTEFEGAFRSYLCVADTHRRRVEEMEREKAEVETENQRLAAQFRQTKRELTALKQRVSKYELAEQVKSDKEEEFKR
uniref:Kinesin-like protein n=1 Tax=Plectus sambesii TaxID=2011161 RepID=A0A914WAB5_9BILA